MTPIGHMKTCFTEKFGVPRQAQMVPAAKGVLKLLPDPAFASALQQLETFSHVWVLFVFDRHQAQPWRSLVEPPRLEQKKVGVFASRSPHRPNPIGMSVVKLERIDLEASGGIEIHLSGVDILDGSPVLDIKPYLPYADRVENASAGWAEGPIDRFAVSFSPASLAALAENEKSSELRELIEQMLSWDPRPSSQRKSMPLRDPQTEGLVFRFRVSRYDVEWQVQNQSLHVLNVL